MATYKNTRLLDRSCIILIVVINSPAFTNVLALFSFLELVYFTLTIYAPHKLLFALLAVELHRV